LEAIVDSLWRYPVKSLIGERIESVELNSRGVAGDRIYAVSNSDGQFGSGKNTRRFRRIDGLFSLLATTNDSGVSIKFPDGSVYSYDDSALNSVLSSVLGESVRLTEEAEIPHFDDGAIHILSKQSLTLLGEFLPDACIAESRFRPNIVLDTNISDADLIGKTIHVGTATLEVTHKTERCRMITLAQPGLESRPEILRVVSKKYELLFGVYARVVSNGYVSVGDACSVK